MKILKHHFNENETTIEFVAESQDERLILGDLRNHFFFGTRESKTFPKYDGMTSYDENHVHSIKLKFQKFT